MLWNPHTAILSSPRPPRIRMKSQVKWGLGLILLGAILLPVGFPFLLIYAVPLILIGIALIIFRNREDRIEQVQE